MTTTPLTVPEGSGSTLFGKVNTAADAVVKMNGIVQAARVARPFVLRGAAGAARFAAALL